MINNKLVCFFMILLFSNINLISQEKIHTVHDSLKKLTYQGLYDKYILSSKDTVKSLIYLNAFLEKGIKENNKIRKAQAYSFLHFYQKDNNEKLKMLDISIQLTADGNHDFFPIVPYSFKGGYYYEHGDYKKSLDNYIKALEAAYKVNNTEYIYITKHNIGKLKSKIGRYKEALAILKQCYTYEKNKESIDVLPYLSSIVLLSETYTKIKETDSSAILIEKYLSLAKNNDSEIYNRLLLNKGINLFHERKIEQAYQNIYKSIDQLGKIQDKSFLITAYFYLGKIQLFNKNQEKAKINFKKVDSIYSIAKYPSEIIRKAYEHLIKFNKSKSDIANQLIYIDKLLKFDSINKINNHYLEEKIQEGYDTPELLNEKEKIIDLLESKNANFVVLNITLFGTILLTIFLFILNYRKRKIYQRKFEDFLQVRSSDATTEKTKNATGYKEDYYIKIPQEIMEKILKNLDEFEENNCFLETHITSTLLAKRFETNSKYLSKIIHYYRHKNFNTYINDLRIDYIVSKLREDTKLRSFTIEAIAKSCGFNTTSAFSKSFYKKTGIYPSYFIKKLTPDEKVV